MDTSKTIFFLALMAATFLTSNSFSIDGHIDQVLLEDLRGAALDQINFYRNLHGAPPVQLNDALNTIAQANSEKMAETMSLKHSEEAVDGTFGENIFMMGSGPAPIQYNLNAVESWYDEINYYDFDSGKSTDPAEDIGHFTAMVWDDVNEIGLGYQAFKIPYN